MARSPQAKRSAARSSQAPKSSQARRSGFESSQAKSLQTRRSAFQFPDNRRSDSQSTGGNDGSFSMDNNCNVPVVDSPPFDASDDDFIE